MGTYWVDILTRFAFIAVSRVTSYITWYKTYSGFVFILLNLFHDGTKKKVYKKKKSFFFLLY